MDRRDRAVTDLIAYVPVLHEGYRRFLEKYREAATIYIFGEELVRESDYLFKEIRALDPSLIHRAIESWNIGPKIGIATPEVLRLLNRLRRTVAMPDEDVCHQVAEKYLGNCAVAFDPVFLRWDRKNSLAEHPACPDRTVTVTQLDREFLALAVRSSEKSSDWWRQVGAVAVRSGKLLLVTYNRHMPSPHTPYVNGDPRNAFFKGVNIELGTSLHAEKGIICEAARCGIALEGASLYVSTLPCPPCSKAIVAAGFKRCYYSSGYALLDGETILRESGVEVIHVPLD